MAGEPRVGRGPAGRRRWGKSSRRWPSLVRRQVSATDSSTMRLGIRAKQIAGVTLIVGVFVVGLSGLYVSQLAQSVLRENEKLARLLVMQIFHRAAEVVPGAIDPYEALRN